MSFSRSAQKRPLSLFFATIAGSGDRKSFADNVASWPISKRETILREEHRDEVKRWKVAVAAWNAERKKIEADKRIDMEGKSKALTMIGPEPLPPLSPFISVSDLTLDGLTKSWVHAHASLAIFTAEGATFTGGHGMSEENRLRTAASLSEVWDGKPVKRVRALDGVAILTGRRVSLHVMIQPHDSHGFLADPALRDQGLLSRILVAAPDSNAGSRLYRDPDPSDDAAIRALGRKSSPFWKLRHRWWTAAMNLSRATFPCRRRRLHYGWSSSTTWRGNPGQMAAL
jgi:hypothetical protein